MLNTININLKTDIKTDRPTTLPIKLMSQDKNNNQFILRFTNGGESVALDDTYTVEILTKFAKSGASRLTSAEVRQDYATWEFDTGYITQDETVYNFVYVRKAGNLVVSADANCFVFSVDLSEIDKGAGKVAEMYDKSYEKVLHDFEVSIDMTKEEWAQMADETRNFVDEIKDVTVDQFVETKMGEELQNLEANYATRLTGLESNDASLTAQLAQTEKKIKGSVSILDFDNLVINKNQQNEDWKDAFSAAAQLIKTSPIANRLVFPAGIYRYSESPNWAKNNIIIESQGEVRLRYTGTGDAVILDAGEVTGSAYNVKFGKFIIECPPNARNALFVRGVHHSEIRAKVVGAGVEHAGLRTEWCVCTDFYISVTSGGNGGWYLGAKPKYGIYIDKRELQPEGLGGYTSWCAFYTPIIELCEIGIHIERGQGNSFYSGTSEAHSKTGVILSQFAIYNKFYGMDLEVNTNFDIYCVGRENDFYSIDSTGTVLFDGDARNNVITGGSLNQIALNENTYGNIVQNVKYNRFNNGSILNDNSGKNTLMSNRNVGLNKTENRPHKSTEIWADASPFTYTNTSGNDVELHVASVGGGVQKLLHIHANNGLQLDFEQGVQMIKLSPGSALEITFTNRPKIWVLES